MNVVTTHGTTRRSLVSRLSLGLAGLMTAAVMTIGLGGTAGATSVRPGAPVPPPQSKAACKNGGWKNFKDRNGVPAFKNQGRCVSWVLQHPGGGYGGGINIDIDIDIDIIVDGNGNTIIINL